jgi:2-methylcitrate dehydratase PrpD
MSARRPLDAASELADFAAGLTFDRLPDEVVSTLRNIVLDTMGTTLAANTMGGACRQLVDMGAAAGGAPESTVMGFGLRVPAAAAALANGAMAHALNYDDTRSGHLGPTSVPPALAAAERRGGVSGRQLIVALAAGNELMARLCLAVEKGERARGEARPQPTQMPGYFNAAVSAGLVLGLDAGGLLSAMSVALMQAAGNRQPVLEGTAAKVLYTGFACHGGILGALLAERGVAAQCAVLEGEAGLFSTFYNGVYEREPLVAGLGDEFHLLDVGFKPWPISANVHPFIEASLELRRQHGIEPSQVQAIHVQGGDHLRPWLEPASMRRTPRVAVEAEDSIYFGVAKALTNGNLVLADFTAEGLRQPESQRLSELVTYTLDPALRGTGIISVRLRDGSSFERRVDASLGRPARPLSRDALVAKFLDCAGHAELPLGAATLDRVVDQVEHLETVEDVASLAELLSGGKA